MDLSLSEDQRAVRSAVREWVDAVVVPDALRNDREERFPQEGLDGLVRDGWIGLTIPAEYGGPELGLLDGHLQVADETRTVLVQRDVERLEIFKSAGYDSMVGTIDRIFSDDVSRRQPLGYIKM